MAQRKPLNSLLSAGMQLEHSYCFVNWESGAQLTTPALFILSNGCWWTTLSIDLMSVSKDQCHICINICDRIIRTTVVSQQEY